MFSLKKHLVEKDLWIYNSDEHEGTARIIEEISMFIAQDRDQWLCSSCLADGGYDTPDLNVCSNACGRSYCDPCAKINEYWCSCGKKLPLDFKCPQCQTPLEEHTEGDECVVCKKLYYFCRKCNEPCEFLGILADPSYLEKIPWLKPGHITEPELEDCGFDFEDREDLEYYEPKSSTMYFDLSETPLEEASAFRWLCTSCSAKGTSSTKSPYRRLLWTNPD